MKIQEIHLQYIGAVYVAAWLIGAGQAILLADGLADTSFSPHAVIHPVGISDVEWTSGFWADRFATCRDQSIPAMWELMRGTEYKPFLQHFFIAAGRAEGRYRGAAWNDGDFYKFLEAVAATWAVTRDPQLGQILAQSIEAIGAAQRDDGYLHTPVLIGQRSGDASAQPFQDRHNFEMYNMGHLLTAACVHHRVTGKGEFLAIARKTADFLYETFRDPTPDLARNSVCPSHYMGMIELCRTTREPRYLELAKTFLDMRNLVTGGGDDNQDRVPFVQQREAVGHAVRANYLYAGAADLYLETGDRRLWKPLEAIWENVTRKKMYITGACGALYDGASPDGSEDQSSITRTHQAYGRNYQLPNTTAHSETCANIGNVLWNWRMFLATGEARFVDVIELALYNSVLSGVSLGGTDYFYVNPLRNTDPLPTELRWSRSRVPFVTSYCCPPNVVRTIAEVNGYAYSKRDNGLFVNLYGSNTVTTRLAAGTVKLRQETEYPWNGLVRITIDQCPPSEFSIHLRIPGWARDATVKLNGAPTDVIIKPGQFCQLRRTWQPGDAVELNLPMPVELIESHPLVEETRNQVAIKRGPVVYCLESYDLPNGVQVDDIIVPLDAKWNVAYEPELLQGVTTLSADVRKRPTGNWTDELYQPTRRKQLQTVTASFIPYYAWANRGSAEMSVWLPVGH